MTVRVDELEPGVPEEVATGLAEIRAQAQALAGEPGDMPQRVAVLHSIFLDSGQNHAFPEVALHGALWAYRFYDRRGTLMKLITYRYFYNARERARRAAMLGRFSDGFKVANRSVFADTFTNYHLTKRFGEAGGLERVMPPELIEALNRVHHAARRGRQLPQHERGEVFRTALLYEQETTVGPKVREEVGAFDCPVLTRLVLKPIVRFAYFPRGHYLRFRDFGNTEERIEKAVRSYQLAERVGWHAVAANIRRYEALPEQFYADPAGYAAGLPASPAAAKD